MIINNVNNLSDSFFDQIVKRVLALNPLELDAGTHQLEGDALFVNRASGETKFVTETQAEIHRQYYDIHLVLNGVESIGFGIEPADATFMADSAFNNDCELVKTVTNEQLITLSAGQFFVIEPGIWHRPMTALTAKSSVNKVIIKVSKDFL